MKVAELKKQLEDLDENVEIIACYDKNGNILFPVKDLIVQNIISKDSIFKEVLTAKLILSNKGKWIDPTLSLNKKNLFKGA